MNTGQPKTIATTLSRARELVGMGAHKQAYKLCRKAASGGAGNPEFCLVYGVCAYGCAKPAEAIKHLRKALRLRPNYPDALFNLGRILLDQGQTEDAAAALSQLVTDHPDYPSALANLAVAYYSSGQMAVAAHTCQQAIKRAPGNLESAELYNLLGSVYRAGEANEQSEKAFRKALELNPAYADALANLSMMLEESARIEDAFIAAEQGQQRFAADPRFALVLAKCQRRQGDPGAALDRLTAIDLEHRTDTFKAQVFYELGRLWDRQDDADQAFECFSKANHIIAANLSPDIKKSFYPKILKASLKFYAGGGELAAQGSVPESPLTPCFLIGFPRSGTTLLELTLAGHRGVAVMEEPPLIQDLYTDITSTNLAYPLVLEQLDDGKVAALRKQYFARAADYTDVTDKQVLINKHPLDGVFLPLINKVFPDAKIIFAARHPLDVCLSCWMQEFQPNEGNVNFLSLHDSAEFYAATLDLWMLVSARATMEKMVISYEDVVDNHEQMARKATEFLGLAWDPSLLEHTKTAKSMPRVNTASYHQVTEAIYVRSKNRWQKYRQQLAQITPKLKRYVEHLGYDL